METRTIHRPSSIAGVRYASPERFTRSPHASVCRSSASPADSRPGGFVAHAHRLQRDRSQHPPARRRPHLACEPLGVREVAAQPGLQAAHALLADQAPQLQRAEPPPERDAPVAVVLHPARPPRSAGSSGWWTSRARGARGRARSRASSRTPRRATCAGSGRASRRPRCRRHIHRHSGRIMAEPAIAASTCSHSPCSRGNRGDGARSGRARSWSSCPVVATTAQGTRPAATSASDRGRRARPALIA